MKTVTAFQTIILYCLYILSTVFSAQAEVKTDTNYYHKVRLAAYAPMTMGYSGTGENIDVVYHRCEWTITPNGTRNITGTVTTYFKTTVGNVKTIRFDLNKTAFNNVNLVVKYHGNSSGVTFTFPTSGNVNILRITLPVTLTSNVLDSVTITYSGAPPAFGDYGEGYEEKSISGMGYVVYTLSESYGDEDWWPCKADMQDKIDSMDIIITTPSTFKAASNGKLMSEGISGSNNIVWYKHKYPIASYLVAIGVANYMVFDRGSVNINGTNVPIVYYIYSGRGANPTTQLNAMDFCKQELVAFSNKFGDYPFKNEKYGMYEFGWGGGMEHQTFSAMGWSTMSSWSVIAHELAHQWFGDKVTFATWNHLWLAEGFAKYGEVLAAELVTSLGQNPVTHRAGIKSTALSTSTTPIYLSDANIANSNLIWTTANDNAVYQRGAMVVSMLRKLAGDTKFFQALRNYLHDPLLAYKSAITDDLKRHFEAVLNYDLDAFFTDYINGTGNPIYTINWGNVGTRINIRLATQTRSLSSTVSYFRTPVVLKIANSTGTKDTTIVIYDQNGSLSYAGNGISPTFTGKVLGYDLSFTPATVTFDPGAETLTALASTNGITKSSDLNSTSFPVYNLIALPIQVIDFKVAPKENAHLLTLSIISTDEERKITAERSENGIDFYTIGEMATIRSDGQEILLQYSDANIWQGHTYFYRVKTIDEKGVIKYSKTVSISNKTINPGFQIIPNPARDNINVVLPLTWKQKKGNIRIYNYAGSMVKDESIRGGNVQAQVSIQYLPAGNYKVELISEDEERLTQSLNIIR